MDFFRQFLPGISCLTVLAFFTAPLAQTTSNNHFGKPVVLVDHAKVINEVQTQYPALQSALFQAFSNVEQVSVVPRSKIDGLVRKSTAGVNPNVKNEDFLIRAKSLLQKGIQAYQQIDFANAQKILSSSRDQWIENLSHLRSNRDLIKAHLYLAMSLMALHKENPTRVLYIEQAQKEFEKVVYLDASLKLSGRSYSPEVIETYERVKQKVLQRSRVSLKVSANIKRANVYVNGKLEGSAPLTLRVLPGTYYLLVEPKKKSIAKPWTSLVELNKPVEEVKAVVKAPINVAKEQHLFRIRENADQQTQDITYLRNRAKALNANMVFLSQLERLDGFRLLGQLYDVRTNEFSQVAFIQMGYDLRDMQGSSYDLAQAMVSQIRADGYLINSAKPNLLQNPNSNASIGKNVQQNQNMQTVEKEKVQLYKKWWFWVGVAALGAGGYYGYQSIQGGSSGDIQINNAGNF